ncbi:MAG: hypothetical protein ACMXYG_05425 [Candidatus Woesearchaeota archaeon]
MKKKINIKLQNNIKIYFSNLYKNSKVFRNLTNFFGISFGASTMYYIIPGCPCCGKPPAMCALSIFTGLIIGFIVGIFFYLWLGIKIVYNNVKKILVFNDD